MKSCCPSAERSENWTCFLDLDHFLLHCSSEGRFLSQQTVRACHYLLWFWRPLALNFKSSLFSAKNKHLLKRAFSAENRKAIVIFHNVQYGNKNWSSAKDSITCTLRENWWIKIKGSFLPEAVTTAQLKDCPLSTTMGKLNKGRSMLCDLTDLTHGDGRKKKKKKRSRGRGGKGFDHMATRSFWKYATRVLPTEI